MDLENGMGTRRCCVKKKTASWMQMAPGRCGLRKCIADAVVDREREVDALPVTKEKVGLPKPSWVSNRARVCIDDLVRSGRNFFFSVKFVCVGDRRLKRVGLVMKITMMQTNGIYLTKTKTKQKQNTDS